MAAGQAPKIRLKSGQLGWLLASWFAFQLVLGIWLLVVPDHLAFFTNQALTLAHVSTALLLLPLAGYAIWRHARRTRIRTRQPLAVWTRWAAAVCAVAGVISGLVALRYGRGMPIADAHGIVGLTVAIPIAVHVWASGRKLAGITLALLAPCAVLAGMAAQQALPPLPLAPATPDFAYQTRPAHLYDRADWCGECHTSIYDEWKRSTHARTLERKKLRHELEDFRALEPINVNDLGGIAQQKVTARVATAPDHPRAFESCTHCHAPASFYGDDTSALLTAPSHQTADAVSCAFCHTIRAVRESPGLPAKFRSKLAAAPAGSNPWQQDVGSLEEHELVEQMSLFVSAPETTRRYFGQASDDPVARWVGNWLIRWRPDVHRADYKSEVLATSQACTVCHGISNDIETMPHQEYATWAKSDFNAGSEDTVHCQDCHMTTDVTGEPRREPGRLVPWGPERPQRRSHLFLGGNVNAHKELGDLNLAQKQHDLNKLAAKVRIEQVERNNQKIVVRVVVTNWMTGHIFPSSEEGFRPAWLHVKVLDSSGRQLAATPEGLNLEDDKDLYRTIARRVDRANNRIVFDTTLQPRASRTFVLPLTLPRGTQPASAVVELFVRPDPSPITWASSALVPSELWYPFLDIEYPASHAILVTNVRR